MSDPWRYQYVSEMLAFYRRARAITEAGGTIRLEWGGREYDAEGWRRQFRVALDRRINLKVGPEPRWRKLDPDYQRSLANDARTIHDRIQRRVRFYSLNTPEMRKRFGHLKSDPREDC